MAIWWPKWNKPSVFKYVYILCYRKSWPPSVNTSEFTGSWTTVVIQCWAWPKKPYWGVRCVSLELAPHWCRYWETASEQNLSLPTLSKLKLSHRLPPKTNFCQLYCKYHLELTFTDFCVSAGRRIPIDPDFKGFLTNNPWNSTVCILLASILQRERITINISLKSFSIFKRN